MTTSGLYVANAASSDTASVAAEVESGVLAGSASVITDPAASAGKAVQLPNAPTNPGGGGDSGDGGSVPGGGSGESSDKVVSSLKKITSPKPMYLDSGLIPPTNKWFSSLAFAQNQNMVSFAYPFAIRTNATGFGLSAPRLVSSPDTVFGMYNEDLSLAFPTNITTSLAAYDDLSATVRFANGSSTLAKTKLTQGSPYAFTTLSSGATLSIKGEGGTWKSAGNGLFTIEVAGTSYALVVDPAKIGTAVEGTNLKVTAKGSDALVTAVAIPAGGSVETLARYALNPITTTSVSYVRNGNNFSTTLSVKTASGGPTLLGLLPEHYRGLGSKPAPVGTYSTVYGPLRLLEGTDFKYTTAARVPALALDLSKLTAGQRNSLMQTVKQDAAKLSFPNEDTYFGFKDLQRGAELYDLAQQLQMKPEADTIKAKLGAELELWLDPQGSNSRATKHFTYDTSFKGIVGFKTAFGSEEYNDHYFHYGYLLNTAAIVSKYDEAFRVKHKALLDVIAKDIANVDRNDRNFPYMRSFDQYTGHAWASGLSPFVDGNNQESSAEGVNAWFGLYRWAVVNKDAPATSTALWLYTREAQAALDYWLNFDRTDPQYAKYNHSIVSMKWNGKSDYATWFSPHPAAKLGIQLLPMSPGQLYLADDLQRIKTNLQGVTGDGTFDAYLLMYRSLFDQAAARSELQALPDAKIDGALSRSYVEAFVDLAASMKNSTSPIPAGSSTAVTGSVSTTSSSSQSCGVPSSATATVSISVPNSTSYELWVRAKGDTSALAAKVDGNCRFVPGTASDWTWLSAGKVSLTEGDHAVALLGSNVALDRILLSSNGCTPSGTGGCEPPATTTTTKAPATTSTTVGGTPGSTLPPPAGGGPVPANLHAGKVADSTITLNWDAVAGATSYEVLREGIVIAEVKVPTFTDIGLIRGTPYTYNVVAITNGTKSARTAPLSLVGGGQPSTPAPVPAPTTTTTAVPAPPGTSVPVPVPPGEVAVPNGLRTSKVSSKEIELRWNAVPGAKRYVILRAGVPIDETTRTTYTNDGLIGKIPYIYSVVAVGADGKRSAPTAEIVVITP